MNHKETITLIQTDINSVIGCYCPDVWEKTTGHKSSMGLSSLKEIANGMPFLFYFLNNKIEIIRHRDDKVPIMRSNKDWLMVIGYGLVISADKNRKSYA